jgi:SAM-dependent methyltransferase
MDEISKEYIINFYDNALQRHGDRPEAVRWTSKGQKLHYHSLLDIGCLEGKKVLDYGCGKGDFCHFLKEQKIKVQYTGFDINDRLIALARGKYPECRFQVFDIESDILREDFDYIFLCGVFNLKVQGVNETVKNTLSGLFKHCRYALVFNGLSAHDPDKDFELNYISPEEVFDFAVKELSPFVSLRHDRIPYDFNLYVYRNRQE